MADNGQRLQQNGDPKVWLVMDGKRRGFNTEAAYKHLYRDWNGIDVRDDVSDVEEGPGLPDDTYLAQQSDEDRTFLVVDGTKRAIPSAEILDRYSFDKSLARSMSGDELAAIPDGAELS